MHAFGAAWLGNVIKYQETPTDIGLVRMTRRWPKAALGVFLIMATLVVSSAAPAFAGTLTTASFTASTPYTYTSAANTRYDWAFTTATSGTLSKVTLGVPAGTRGSNKYLALPNMGGNYASTPSSASNSLTGSFDVRLKVALANWSPGSAKALVTKDDWSYTRGIGLYVAANNSLQLVYNIGGTAKVVQTATNFTNSYSAGQTVWVRATRDGTTGVAAVWTSSDGTNWTSQASSSLGTAAMSATTYPLLVGAITASGTPGAAVGKGKYYYMDLRNSITGTTSSATSCAASGVVACFSPDDETPGNSTWNSSSPTSETWTVNRTTSALMPADLASDLTITNLSGLPSGGIATYRYIDINATYLLATATSVSASTPCAISLQGFTNTATTGSYASTISTWDTQGPPAVLIDSATTATLSFASDSSNTADSVTIDPSFTFTIGNQSSACNGESNFVTGAGGAASVALAHLSSNANVSGGQALVVASNAGSGFAVYLRGAQVSQNLRSAGHNWSDVAGTYSSPAALGSGEAFGYTWHDATSSTSVTNPASASYAALDNTNQAVMGSYTSPNGNACVSFDVQSTPSSPAGTYSATVIYVAVPSF